MAGVKVKFDGDKTQLEQAYRDLAASHAKLENQVAKLGQVSAKAAKDQLQGQSSANAAVRAGIDDVKSMAASWLSVGGLISAAGSQLQEFQRIQEAATRETESVGRSQSKLLFNLAGSSTEDRSGFLAEISKIQKDTSFPDIKQLYDTASSSLAANGGNTAQALAMTRAVAALARNSPGDANAIALGATTMQEVIGGTPEEAIGMMSTIGGPSYIADPAQQARYIPNAIKAMMETSSAKTVEERRREAKYMGAMLSGLGVVAGDKEGMSTRTEGIDFAVDLEEGFAKGYEVTLPNGRKIRKKLAGENDPGTFEGRVEYLKANEKARKLFEDNSTNEKQFYIPRREALRGGGVTDRKIQEFLPQIRADKADYDSLSESQAAGSDQIRAATSKARQDAIEQQRQITQPKSVLETQAREIRKRALENTRQYSGVPVIGYLQEKAIESLDDARYADGIDSAIKMLDQREKQVRQKRGILGDSGGLHIPGIYGTPFGRGMTPEDQLSDRQKQDLGYINEQRQELRRLKEEAKRAETGVGPSATGGNLLHAIKEQTRLAAEHGARQEKLTEEQTQAMHELIRQQANKRPIGAPQDEIGRHRER